MHINMIETKNRLMQEIMFSGNDVDGHMLEGFIGAIAKRSVQPGMYVPRQLMNVYMPKSDGVPATRIRVEIKDDPDQYFVANVSRGAPAQYIVAVPIRNGNPDPRFPPGTVCFVRMATAQDE